MSKTAAISLIFFSILTSCASRQGGAESVDGRLSRSERGQRFQNLEATAQEFDASAVANLPEIAEEDALYVLESVIGAPPLDQSREGYVILPPEEWTIGNTSDGEEIRVTLLEVSGGSMLIDQVEGLELPDEVTATWVVRYERRNVLLTEDGAALSIHMIPVAVRLDLNEEDPLFWISPDAL